MKLPYMNLQDFQEKMLMEILRKSASQISFLDHTENTFLLFPPKMGHGKQLLLSRSCSGTREQHALLLRMERLGYFSPHVSILLDISLSFFINELSCAPAPVSVCVSKPQGGLRCCCSPFVHSHRSQSQSRLGWKGALEVIQSHPVMKWLWGWLS